MQATTINNHQRTNPSFQARLVCDKGTRGIVQTKLADYFAKSIDPEKCPTLKRYKNLTGKDAFRWLQHIFKENTKNIDGTFKLTPDSQFPDILEVSYKDSKGKITTQSPETTPLFSIDILPDVVEGPNISFNETVARIVRQIFGA